MNSARWAEGVPVTKVSVCIPVYNSAATVERSIESVLTQTYRDFECIVVDNHSNDATVEKVAAFTDPRIRLVRNETNIGLVGNHNKCVRIARGQLIQFVHGDDWLLPHCLERLVPAFDSPNVGMAFARRRVQTTNASWKARYGRLDRPLQPLSAVNEGRELIRKYLAAGGLGNTIGEPTSVMLRRETLIAAGAFHQEVRTMADIDTWLRVLIRSDAAFVDDELTVRWHHADSATDVFAGSEILDNMWMLSHLITSAELGSVLRLRALALWLKDLARSSKEVLDAPTDQRTERLKRCARNVRYVATGQRLQFECGANA
jgi:glycosyltransferase involved in cell wall biosynthesis